tara:strand:+ start:892 stop:1143 length:252 start_codon:yes stop_codon:yes gene_type:complete
MSKNNELVPANEDELQIIKKIWADCDCWGADCITEHEIKVLPGTDIFYVYTKGGEVVVVGVSPESWKHCGLEVPIWRQEDVRE